jgi:PadR family transcriptional regulator
MLRGHMDAPNAGSGRAPEPDVDAAEMTADGVIAPAPSERSRAIASGRDAAGVAVHRGWAPLGGHRWMEPFVMVLLAGGAAHGYAIVGELEQLGVTNGSVDVGQVYRTLRDLEEAGMVRSSWATGTGPARREYALTPDGRRALDEWAAVMKERVRLGAEFEARYLEWVAIGLD